MCVYTSRYCMVCYPDGVRVYDNDTKKIICITDTTQQAQAIINRLKNKEVTHYV